MPKTPARWAHRSVGSFLLTWAGNGPTSITGSDASLLRSKSAFRFPHQTPSGQSAYTSTVATRATDWPTRLTNATLSSSLNWSNVFTTPTAEPRFWSYPSLGVTNSFHFLRVRENDVPNWPN